VENYRNDPEGIKLQKNSQKSLFPCHLVPPQIPHAWAW